MNAPEIDLEILPFEGIGPVRFGMTPDQVATLLGPPGRSRHRRFENLVESRGPVTFMYDSGNRLEEIGFGRDYKRLSYKGLRVFVAPPREVLRRLIEQDGHPYTSCGFVVLFKLGMTLTGFEHGDEDDKALTIFQEGVWDKEVDELEDYRFS